MLQSSEKLNVIFFSFFSFGLLLYSTVETFLPVPAAERDWLAVRAAEHALSCSVGVRKCYCWPIRDRVTGRMVGSHNALTGSTSD